jgi:hypothetical protein
MIDQMKAYVGGDCEVGEYEFEINVIPDMEMSLAVISGDKETGKINFSSLDEMEKVATAILKVVKTMKNQ